MELQPAGSGIGGKMNALRLFRNGKEKREWSYTLKLQKLQKLVGQINTADTTNTKRVKQIGETFLFDRLVCDGNLAICRDIGRNNNLFEHS